MVSGNWFITPHKKIAERHGSHLALDSGGSANGEFIRLKSIRDADLQYTF